MKASYDGFPNGRSALFGGGSETGRSAASGGVGAAGNLTKANANLGQSVDIDTTSPDAGEHSLGALRREKVKKGKRGDAGEGGKDAPLSKGVPK